MLEFITETKTVWERIQTTDKPIALYGMGDGAEKILRVMQSLQKKPDAVFASDGFVRHNAFAGYTVCSLSEVEERYGDPLILLCFASERPDVLQYIQNVAARHELLAPDVPVTGNDLFDNDYLYNHKEEIQTVYKMLADERSKQTYAACLNYKISGKIDYLLGCQTDKATVWSELICPTDTEHYVDLGAYNGDTVAEFLSATDGHYTHITAFEPDGKNYRKLTARCENLKNCTLLNIGAHSERGELYFASKAGRNSALSDKGTRAVAVDSVDNRCTVPPTIIKFDVEGAEYDALTGCRKVIAAHKPKLMVSAYHRNEDLFKLPLYIQKLNPAYTLYCRHLPYLPCWETNFYAL